MVGKGKKVDEDEDMNLDDELLSLHDKKSNKRVKDSDDSEDDRKKKKPAPARKSTGSGYSKPGVGKSKGRSNNNDSDSDNEFNDGYDEDMYKDEEDRDDLMKLPEFKREDILATRWEQRKQAKEIWTAKKRQREREQSKDNYESRSKESSSSSTSGSSSSRRRSSTTEDDSGKGKALKVIKEKSITREHEKERDLKSKTSSTSNKQLTEEQKREKSKEKEMEKEKQIERDREAEREKERSIQYKIQDKLQTFALGTLNQVTLSRNMLVKWVDQPYFTKYTPGFFVRVVIGKFQNLPVYRIGKIMEITTGHKIYKVENKETDKLLSLSYAGTIKKFGIDLVSNTAINQTEYERWVQDMIRANVDFPSDQDIQNKINDIKKANEYVYTNEDIENRAKERKKFNKAAVNYSFKKLQAKAKLETYSPDSEEYKILLEKIKKYDEKIGKVSADDTIDKINQRNKTFNIKSQQNSASQESSRKEVDPFARRKTRSKFEIESINTDDKNGTTTTTISNNTNGTKNNNNNGVESMDVDTKKNSNTSLSEIHNAINLDIIIPDTLSRYTLPTIQKHKVNLNLGFDYSTHYKTQDPSIYNRGIISMEEYIQKQS